MDLQDDYFFSPPPRRIVLQKVPSSRQCRPEWEKLCAKNWKKLLAQARQQGSLLWEGQVCRLEGIEQKNSAELKLKVSLLPYSRRLALSSLAPEIKKAGLAFAPLGISTAAFLQTKDGYFLFIKKSNKFFAPRRFSFVGGSLSANEMPDLEKADVYQEIRKEIKEEIGLPFSLLKNLRLFGGLITITLNFSLLFYAPLAISRAEAEKLFSQRLEPEAKNLVAVPAADLEAWTEKNLLHDKKKIIFFLKHFKEIA